MSAERKKFVVIQVVTLIVINTIVSSFISWVMLGSLEMVPLWGTRSVAGNTIVGVFMMISISCFIITKVVHLMVKNKPHLRSSPMELHPVIKLLSQSLVKRSVRLGLVTTLLVSPVVLGLLIAYGIPQVTFAEFITFKASGSAVLTALLGPLMIIRALAD